MKRKEFLRNACLSGACLCGFGSTAFSQEAGPSSSTEEKQETLPQAWIALLLRNASLEADQESLRRLIRQTADAHYRDLKMDDLLSKYLGDLPAFILFLQESWGWKIDYNEESGVLIADENKKTCVCPIIGHRADMDSSAICYCSEGFAEKMFSKVAERLAQAEILSSVRRGDATCRYKITFA